MAVNPPTHCTCLASWLLQHRVGLGQELGAERDDVSSRLGITRDDSVAHAGVDEVVALASVNLVLAALAVDDVAAESTDEGVGAGAAEEGVLVDKKSASRRVGKGVGMCLSAA